MENSLNFEKPSISLNDKDDIILSPELLNLIEQEEDPKLARFMAQTFISWESGVLEFVSSTFKKRVNSTNISTFIKLNNTTIGIFKSSQKARPFETNEYLVGYSLNTYLMTNYALYLFSEEDLDNNPKIIEFKNIKHYKVKSKLSRFSIYIEEKSGTKTSFLKIKSAPLDNIVMYFINKINHTDYKSSVQKRHSMGCLITTILVAAFLIFLLISQVILPKINKNKCVKEVQKIMSIAEPLNWHNNTSDTINLTKPYVVIFTGEAVKNVIEYYNLDASQFFYLSQDMILEIGYNNEPIRSVVIVKFEYADTEQHLFYPIIKNKYTNKNEKTGEPSLKEVKIYSIKTWIIESNGKVREWKAYNAKETPISIDNPIPGEYYLSEVRISFRVLKNISDLIY